MNSKTKSIITISVANGLNSLAYGIAIPFFAIYLSTRKGVPAGVIGLMLALAMATTALASAISGEVSDTFGRRRVMLCSLFFRAATMLAMAWAMYIDAHYFWAMFFHFAGSFSGAFFRPASNAWIADTTTPAERVKAFGYVRIGLNLGWCIGPALGGLLAKASFALGFGATACTYLITMFFVARYINETLTKENTRKANFITMLLDLKDKNLAALCAYNFIISMVMAQLVVGLSLHAILRLGMTENIVGLFFSLNGLAVVLFQFPVAAYSSKIRLTSALALGCFLYALGYGAIGFMVSSAGIMLGVVVSAIGEMCVLPAGHSLASNLAADNKKGRYLGLYVLSNAAGQAAGIFMAGVLMEKLSPLYAPAPWIIVAGLGALAGILFLSMRRTMTPEQDGVTPAKPAPPTPIVKQLPS
jgi:MFS family permease